MQEWRQILSRRVSLPPTSWWALCELDPPPADLVLAMTKDIDITVYGATGFTGCRIVQQLTAWLGREEWSALSVGIAGRRESALREVAKPVAEALGSRYVLLDMGHSVVECM